MIDRLRDIFFVLFCYIAVPENMRRMSSSLYQLGVQNPIKKDNKGGVSDD